VAQDRPELRDALLAALIEIQKAGIETDLLKKWSLDAGTLEAARLVTSK
jgi:polar amino acid transport system substrate-binding protein